jgi:hypothetical protein
MKKFTLFFTLAFTFILAACSGKYLDPGYVAFHNPAADTGQGTVGGDDDDSGGDHDWPDRPGGGGSDDDDKYLGVKDLNGLDLSAWKAPSATEDVDQWQGSVTNGKWVVTVSGADYVYSNNSEIENGSVAAGAKIQSGYRVKYKLTFSGMNGYTFWPGSGTMVLLADDYDDDNNKVANFVLKMLPQPESGTTMTAYLDTAKLTNQNAPLYVIYDCRAPQSAPTGVSFTFGAGKITPGMDTTGLDYRLSTGSVGNPSWHNDWSTDWAKLTAGTMDNYKFNIEVRKSDSPRGLPGASVSASGTVTDGGKLNNTNLISGRKDWSTQDNKKVKPGDYGDYAYAGAWYYTVNVTAGKSYWIEWQMNTPTQWGIFEDHNQSSGSGLFYVKTSTTDTNPGWTGFTATTTGTVNIAIHWMDVFNVPTSNDEKWNIRVITTDPAKLWPF